jgi:DNA-binding MarR family transcriptional regulator
MDEAPNNLASLIALESFVMSAAFRRHGDLLAGPQGQTQARWQVLRLASSDIYTVPQIARRLGVSRQSVQRLADVLIQEGLAKAADNPDHSASPLLILTPVGRGVLQRLAMVAAEYKDLVAKSCANLDLATILLEFKAINAALAQIDEAVESLGAGRSSAEAIPKKRRARR